MPVATGGQDARAPKDIPLTLSNESAFPLEKGNYSSLPVIPLLSGDDRSLVETLGSHW